MFSGYDIIEKFLLAIKYYNTILIIFGQVNSIVII